MSTKTVALIPSENWKEANATFAAYVWKGETNRWITGTDEGAYIQFDLPADIDGLIFVRLKPSTAEGYSSGNGGLNWDNKWNQSPNLTLPADDNIVYTVSGWDSGSWGPVPDA